MWAWPLLPAVSVGVTVVLCVVGGLRPLPVAFEGDAIPCDLTAGIESIDGIRRFQHYFPDALDRSVCVSVPWHSIVYLDTVLDWPRPYGGAAVRPGRRGYPGAP